MANTSTSKPINPPAYTFSRTTSLLFMLMATLIALGFVSGCAKDLPINPDDPLENPGVFDIHISDINIPNPEKDDQALSGTIYYPSSDQGLTRTQGDYPLILLTPGFSASYTYYQRYAKHFVSHGFVVLGFNFAPSANSLDGEHDYKARQISYAIDYMLGDQSGLPSDLEAHAIGLAGHSMGAKVGFYAAALDDRISAIAAMDPVNAGGPPCFISPSNCAAYPVAPNPTREAVGVLENTNVASLIFRSAPDALFNPDNEFNASWFFEGYDLNGLYAVPSPAVYIDMGNTSHAAYLPLLSQSLSAFLKRTMTAWFITHLQGELMDSYYQGEIIQDDLENGSVVSVTYR